MRRRRGFNLVEVVISAAFFSAVSAVALVAMLSAVNIWNHTGSRDETLRRIERAWNALRRDLSRARISSETFRVGPSPNHTLAGAADGDAVCLLSPVNPETGQLVCNKDGSPFMMRTIVYHLAVPENHSALCTGVRNQDGYEVGCPHKVLWREVLDQDEPTRPEGMEELLGEQWQPLVQRRGEVVATNLLMFRCQTVGPSLRVELRATLLREASQSVAIGSVDLSDKVYTVKQNTSVFPQN